tara:strand:- start:3728 stop:4126 length:399 start_codon:yes stop_codon:yes gene_type:complete
MGLTQSINKINCISMQNIINDKTKYLIINTLTLDNQNCLIKNTVQANTEVELLNNYLKENNKVNIVIYGENSCDHNVVNKYNQLYKLGFNNLYVYVGGLFEWLLLQDIYGDDEFPTTSKILDILKYKGKSII